MSGAITEPGDLPARPGRHRRSAGAGTWTPVVRPRHGGGRHQAAVDDDPPAPSPLLASSIDPDDRFGYRALARPSVPGVPAQSRQATFAPPESVQLQGLLDDRVPPEPAVEHFAGELSLDEDLPLTTDEQQWDDELVAKHEPVGPAGNAADEPDTAGSDATESIEEPTVRRTRVTLTPAVERDDDVRIYLAPPPDGLSKFDLGTIPASVTPPRTWRKAAWFATVSSGGVVVALLVAGSYLVGQPANQNMAVDRWPELPGVQYNDEYVDKPSERAEQTGAAPDQPRPTERISDAAIRAPRSSSLPSMPSLSSAPGSATVTGTPSATATATTSQEPQKPPPTAAERETRTAAFYSFPPDADTMGDRSEIFFNYVTEDPETAWEQTGGELYAEGPDGIARRYAAIAYFEVEHIFIDQRKRTTVNTLRVHWKDGTVTDEQRTLRFEEGDKITSD